MTHVPWHPDEADLSEEIHGIESVELHSVGIDIGTTTSHLMVSRLLARRDGDFSSKFRVVEKDSVYQSDISLTPFEDEDTIDTERLDSLIQGMYEASGFEPSDIDTGAVIVTGEASKKKNAARIAEMFSEKGGEFVCATAGPDLEALMAAHGSGAVDYALESENHVLHLDIGGGTTKLAYIIDGFVEETAAISIGARLVEFANEDGSISRVEDAARVVADRLDMNLEIGERLSERERQELADEFADLLLRLIVEDDEPVLDELMVNDRPESHPFDVITFSGGVAEYVYNRDLEDYEDLGPELGDAIRTSIEEAGYEYAELEAGIRATAIGSTEDNVQISGNTITLTNVDLLPMRNVPIVPFVIDEDDELEVIIDEIREKVELYDADVFYEPFAYGFHLHGSPSYKFIDKVVSAAVAGWEYVESDHPLILAFESDVAMNAGRLAEEYIDDDVISVDGVDLDQFGYIDIGKPVEETAAVPLTVKSLVFKG